jgi:hypothetical protein
MDSARAVASPYLGRSTRFRAQPPAGLVAQPTLRNVSATPRGCYFDDVSSEKACPGIATRESQLEVALRANSALRVEAERLIAAYVAPESERAAIMHELIALFDGPAQREARAFAATALCEDWREHNSGEWPPVSL